ncbi:MAG: ABC transporter substrate-binding protein [Anaerolineales bacterium]|nr:ABC transporter substrate-binding protein [Anaerolineales bacterium]
MHKSKSWVALSAVMILSMILAACAPQVVTKEVIKEVTAPPQVVIQTQVLTQVVEIEKEAWTTPHPILSDLRVRQAIAYCTDRIALIKSVYDYLSPEEQQKLLMDSFIQSSHWAHAKGLPQYPFDPEKGKALLEEAGWKLAEGAQFRTNANGEELSLRFTTTNAQFRQTWAAVFEKNMSDCGIRILRLHAPGAWWFGSSTGLRRRDFELGAFAWVGEADPGGRTLYACDQIPTPANNWRGQNYMGWCNERADANIKLANNTLNREERIKAYAAVQEEFAKDMVSLPVFARVEHIAHSANLKGPDPAPGEPYVVNNIHEWELADRGDTLILGYTQEPATLFTLIESAFVASNAKALIDGLPIISKNYDYTVNLYFKQLPTLENGGAVLNAVEPKAGDKVVDVNGDIVDLAEGVKVKDEKGNEVEWKPGVKMQQIVLTWELEPGIKWSDGKPLVAADMELGKKITCDPESGAVDFTTCERTVGFEVTDTTQKITLMPGYTPPLYFTIFYGWYPSHQEIGGRKLADIPAKEWSTLKEIAELPMGTGPYIIKEWTKGQQMVFEANPNFYKGAPKIKKIIIKFIADTKQAVAQLLTGDVDMLFGETLVGAEAGTVAKAAAEPNAKVIFHTIPSATWEHIDFNLNVR